MDPLLCMLISVDNSNRRQIGVNNLQLIVLNPRYRKSDMYQMLYDQYDQMLTISVRGSFKRRVNTIHKVHFPINSY